MTKSLTSKQQHWLDTLNDWKASGLTQTKYCRQHDINLKHFYCYKSKLMSERKQEIDTGHFVPIASEPSEHEQLILSCNDIDVRYSLDTNQQLVKSVLQLIRSLS